MEFDLLKADPQIREPMVTIYKPLLLITLSIVQYIAWAEDEAHKLKFGVE